MKYIRNKFVRPLLFALIAGLVLNLSFSGIFPQFFKKANAAYVAYGFSYPIDDYEKESLGNFGEDRENGVFHLGNDIGKVAGTAVYATADGFVKHVGEHTNFGTVVLVEHELPNGEKVVSLYGHLRRKGVRVSEGKKVHRGDTLGYLGNRSENGGFGEHLHFGIRKGEYVDVKHWVYWGLGARELINDWHDPTQFVGDHLKLAEPGKRILAGPGPSGSTHVRAFRISGEVAEANNTVFESKVHGGTDVASGDFDGDGHDEIVFAAGPGYKPEVSVRNKFNEEESIFLAYDKKLRSGVWVSAGDVDGDGKDEIVTAPRKGGNGRVRIFEKDGKARSLEFWPYGPKFKGGIDIAVAQVDGDPKEEIVFAPESGYKPLVKIYEPQKGNDIYKQFLAFDKKFDGGVRISAGDVDLDGGDEIVVGTASKGGQVRVFEAQSGKPRGIEFYPFGRKHKNGVDVGTNDFNDDGKTEIIIGSGVGAANRIKVYKYNSAKEILADFIPYDKKFKGGVNVSGATF